MNTEIKQYLSKIGRKGGQTTVDKYGLKKMKEWGKLGGRPKKAKVSDKILPDKSIDKPSR